MNDESAGTAMRANAISWACDSGEHALVAATHFVCLWPKADTPTAEIRVRFRGQSGHDSPKRARQLLTQSGHGPFRIFAAQIDR